MWPGSLQGNDHPYFALEMALYIHLWCMYSDSCPAYSKQDGICGRHSDFIFSDIIGIRAKFDPTIFRTEQPAWICRFLQIVSHGPVAKHIKLQIAHAPGMPGTFSPPPRVSGPDLHNYTCVTPLSWWRPGSLTSGFLWSRWPRKNVPGIPGACATREFTYLVRGR